MGYRIEYDNRKKVMGLEKIFSRRLVFTGCCFLVFLLATFTFWQEGEDAIRYILFPGDPSVAVSSFAKLTEDLQNGESIFTSLQFFCQQILNGANLDFH